MKKFFTLIVLAVIAFTANAKVQMDFPSAWGSSCTVEGTTYSFDGTWAGAGTWLGTYDATGYDYAVCVYENHTGADINFGVTYNVVVSHESWGDNYKTVTLPIDQENGYVAIPLDQTSTYDDGTLYYQSLRQLQLQDGGAAGSVTIDGLYLMTAAEVEALSAPTEGVFKLEGIDFGLGEDGTVTAWSWIQQATNDSESHQDETTGDWITDKEATYDYKDASAYDYIVVQFEQNTVGAHFFCVDGSWSKQIATDFVAEAEYVAVDLATSEVASFKDNIACFVMQPFADGILKIKEVDYMTAAAYQEFLASKADKVYEKDLALPGENGVITMPGDEGAGWYSPGWINGLTGLDNLYKTLVFEVASADAHYQLMVQGSEDGSTWNDAGFTTFSVASHTDPAVIALPVEGKHVNLGQFAFQNMNILDSWMDPSTGEMTSEYGDNKVVVTRVYLTSEVVESDYPEYVDPEGISEVNSENANSNVMFNIAGQRVNNAKGLVILNGKKYLAK